MAFDPLGFGLGNPPHAKLQVDGNRQVFFDTIAAALPNFEPTYQAPISEGSVYWVSCSLNSLSLTCPSTCAFS
jgi:hypothetical protein